jgi:hypothetical protein
VDQRNPHRANPPAKVDKVVRRLWVEGGPKASSRAEEWRGHSMNFTPTDACAPMRVFPDALRPGKQSRINLSQFEANLSAA